MKSGDWKATSEVEPGDYSVHKAKSRADSFKESEMVKYHKGKSVKLKTKNSTTYQKENMVVVGNFYQSNSNVLWACSQVLGAEFGVTLGEKFQQLARLAGHRTEGE